MRTSRALIVALGNRLHGDDRFGALVLERLREDPLVRRAAGFLDAHTDLLGQIDTLAAHPRVILLDCVAGSEFEDGGVMVFSEAELRRWARCSTGCHHLAPLETVDLLRMLFPDAGTRIDLVALCIDRLAWKPRWSGAPAVDEAVDRVRDLLRPARGAPPRAGVRRPRRGGVAH